MVREQTTPRAIPADAPTPAGPPLSPCPAGLASPASPAAPADAELMARLARSDLSALAMLVKRHQDRLRRLAYRFTGRWDSADDIAQEAFLRLWRSAGRYKPAAAFSTWLYRIVVNLCLDHARRPRMALLDEEKPPAGADPAPPQVVERQERIEAIRREVAALPERQRIVLLLHRFEDMDHAAVVQATGWSASAVESLLVRAYARLREKLKDT